MNRILENCITFTLFLSAVMLKCVCNLYIMQFSICTQCDESWARHRIVVNLCLDGLACEDYGLMRCDYILVAVYHLSLLSG